MNTHELEQARENWLAEKKVYKEYAESIKFELENTFKDKMIPATITSRVKEDASLLKKMLYNNISYSAITDKVGIRLVVHFLSDLRESDNLIQENYGARIMKRDDKLEAVDEYTFGYLSIHYDIISSTQDKMPLIAELQLRTTCQNAWSELSHILSYKPGIDLPVNIKREVNALSALMEVADNQFQKIYDMVDKLPVYNPTRILRTLSNYFYTYLEAWYDSKISYYFLEGIETLYEASDNILAILQNFIALRGETISRISKERKDIIFFSQPEIVVILERLENRKHLLADYWQKRFPLDQLEYIANAWGISLD